MSAQTVDAPIAGGLYDNDLRESGGYNYGGYVPGYDYLPQRPKYSARAYLSSAVVVLSACAALLMFF